MTSSIFVTSWIFETSLTSPLSKIFFFLEGIMTTTTNLKGGITKTKACFEHRHSYQQQRHDVFVSARRSEKSSCTIDNFFCVHVWSDLVTRHHTSRLPRYSEVNRSWRHWMQTEKNKVFMKLFLPLGRLSQGSRTQILKNYPTLVVSIGLFHSHFVHFHTMEYISTLLTQS